MSRGIFHDTCSLLPDDKTITKINSAKKEK